MNSRFCFCFCFKRNRASYQISYKTSNERISQVPTSSDEASKPHYENITDLSDDRQIEANNKSSIPTTSMTCNAHTNKKLEDYSGLYATVDKTRRAKNSIRITPGTKVPASISTTAPQPIPSLNSYSSERTSKSLPLYTNVLVNMRTSDHSRASNYRRSHYDGVKPRESLSNRDRRSEIEKEKSRPVSLISSIRTTSSSPDLYAEILINSSTSDMICPNRQRESYFSLLNDDKQGDDISDPYATIE